MTIFGLKVHHFVLGALFTLLLVRPIQAANSMNFDMGTSAASTTVAKASVPAAASARTTVKVIEKIVCEGSKDSGVLHLTGKNLEKPSADLAGGKLVLIFKNTRLAVSRKIKGAGLVREIRSSAHKDKSAWVVIDENGVRHYTIDVVDSGVIVHLNAAASVSGSEKTIQKSKAPEPKSVAAKTMVSPKSDSRSASGLKTYARLLDASLRPESESLKIVFTADSPARYTVRKLSTPEKLVLRFSDTHLDVPDKEKEIRGDAKLTESSGL
ncbi:MAG: AMIN domain-containing protein, partial [bacterium]